MKQKNVYVVFDRKYKVKKDEDGIGTVDVFIYLTRSQRKYIAVGKCKRSEFEDFKQRREVQAMVRRCEKVIMALDVLKLEANVENFTACYNKEEEAYGNPTSPLNFYNGVDQSQSFIDYMQTKVDGENIRKGTRIRKQVTIDALKRFGKIKTFSDLTPAKIMAFDTWLHDGTRTDVTVYTYHKHLRKLINRMRMADMIPSNPYDKVKISRGQSKERKPLTEEELQRLRDLKLEGKLDRVRDLFIFAAYTGLAYADMRAFDFNKSTVKCGDMYYIDGLRIKTDSPFFTPILSPAMEVLKKYNYKLPCISNMKLNDYLHVVEAKLGLKKPLTYHVARHTFATLVLSYDVPIEDLARMLGHKNVQVTQIYAKILHQTIERHSEKLQSLIK